MKPKEWWITWNFTGSLAGVTENDRTSEYMTSVHVIEKFAYDESVAENEILKSKASQFKSTMVETMRVRDKFRTELEQAKLTIQAISKNSLENRDELEHLRQANAGLVDMLRKHVEKYCPKSTNQSACTWTHDYQDLRQALAKYDKGI